VHRLDQGDGLYSGERILTEKHRAALAYRSRSAIPLMASHRLFYRRFNVSVGSGKARERTKTLHHVANQLRRLYSTTRPPDALLLWGSGDSQAINSKTPVVAAHLKCNRDAVETKRTKALL